MIWGLPKISHAAIPMASGFFGRLMPLGWFRVNNDLIAQTIIVYEAASSQNESDRVRSGCTVTWII